MNTSWAKEMTKQEVLDQTFLECAFLFAKLSHCKRIQVGSVLVSDNRIISTGYNGTPKGYENCDFHFRNDTREINDPTFKSDHAKWSVREVHSEINALMIAAKNGIPTDGTTFYITISPCIDCAKAMIQAGVKRVVFNKPYDRDSYPIEFMKENGIEVEQCDLK